MKKPEIDLIENKRINDRILELCHVPMDEDFLKAGRTLNTWLPKFLPYFQHIDTKIINHEVRLQGWLDLKYLSEMKILPEGMYEFDDKNPDHIIVWSIFIKIEDLIRNAFVKEL